MPRRPGPPSPAQCNPLPLPAVLLARELPPGVGEARERRAEWTRVRPGAYTARQPPGAPDRDRALALARIVAASRQLRLTFAFSHQSAALVWGLPLLAIPDRTHVIQDTHPGRRAAKDLVRHIHTLPAQHRTIHRSLPVCTLERTVVDCLRTLEPLAGLVVADAGLHLGADRDLCRAMLDAPSSGCRKARALLDLADDGAESAGETHLRFAFLRAGLPVPTTQIRIRTRLGEYWSDLGWEEWRLVAEYDGRVKYGARGSDALVAEKRRQDAIEEERWHVLRVVKEDLRRPGELLRRVSRFAPPGTCEGLRPRRMLGP